MKRSAAFKTGAAGLSFLYFLTNCALAGAVERNTYNQRLASLPSPILTTSALRPIPASVLPAFPALSEMIGRLPASLGTSVEACEDRDRLRIATRKAGTIASLDDFQL